MHNGCHQGERQDGDTGGEETNDDDGVYDPRAKLVTAETGSEGLGQMEYRGWHSSGCTSEVLTTSQEDTRERSMGYTNCSSEAWEMGQGEEDNRQQRSLSQCQVRYSTYKQDTRIKGVCAVFPFHPLLFRLLYVQSFMSCLFTNDGIMGRLRLNRS